jgi:hypothetical protein
MSKYIIKNCPAYNPKHCDCLNTKEIACLYRTDCVLKQIVELAKGYKEELIDRKTKKVVATRYFKLTKEILELLDIQEVE